ncbi:MAG: hypothetical protein CL912_16480 [Deltaproteobacteria bacterium]|nr:hypothetical protein [Deltaproteobacteria bacterium]
MAVLIEIQEGGLEGARRNTIPAYTFTKFRQLPVELQENIWSMATRSGRSKIRKILAMRYDVSPSHGDGALAGRASEGSSRIIREHNTWTSEKTPVTLCVCRDSRRVAQRIHTRMRFCGARQRAQRPEAYFNTLYDQFYLAEYPWNDFKLLIDILIKQNTTRPLQPKVERDMDRFFEIRYLTVDFHIFAGVPTSVWVEFPKLVKLTIGIYPYEAINDREAIPDRDLGFVKPQRGSKYGKRADWVLSAASTALRAAGDERRHWKMPELEVLVRLTGDEIDDTVEEHWTEDLEEYEQAVALYMGVEDSTEQEQENTEDNLDDTGSDHANEDGTDEEADADSAWFEQADARMKQTISPAEIKLLKQEHHPSRKIFTRRPNSSPNEWWEDEDIEVWNWISDSETESGETYPPNRPFIYPQTSSI